MRTYTSSKFTSAQLAVALLWSCGFAAAQSASNLSIFSVTNPGDFQPGLPSAGSLASILTTGLVNPSSSLTISPPLGALPRQLAGVQVLINGTPAPIAGIAFLPAYQAIKVQVPWETAGDTVTIEVTQSGSSAQATAPVVGAALFFFSAFFADGQGYGQFLHVSDYSAVTPQNPAHPGEYLMAYALNLGPVSNRPATGVPTPDSPYSIPISVAPVCGYTEQLLVGNVASNVQFEGLAPGLVGVYQINFQVPLSLSAGDASVSISRQLDEDFYSCSEGQTGHSFFTQISRAVVLPVR
jgi:uncharacterized protein (TIGR03437 family)